MERVRFTLKAWPVITLITVTLCFLTQYTAGLFGIDLPDQKHVGLVRDILLRSFESREHLLNSLFLVSQVIVLLPVAEEFIFRYLAVRLPARFAAARCPHATATAITVVLTAVSAALFTAAHYMTQPFPDAAFIALFFFGLAQCRLYAKTGRLWCPMLNHALFNLTNLILALTLPDLG